MWHTLVGEILQDATNKDAVIGADMHAREMMTLSAHTNQPDFPRQMNTKFLESP
jgi:hypothetical protein